MNERGCSSSVVTGRWNDMGFEMGVALVSERAREGGEGGRGLGLW